MAISKERKQELKAFHQALLDKVGASSEQIIPKCFFTPRGKEEKYIALWPSELKGVDLYIESCTADGDPEVIKEIPATATRGLFRWKFNPFFEEEYERLEPYESTGHRRYLIPVGELIVVTGNEKIRTTSSAPTPVINKLVENKLDLTLADPETDLPIDQLTIRDFAAIMLSKPVSRKEWLNEIIKSK